MVNMRSHFFKGRDALFVVLGLSGNDRYTQGQSKFHIDEGIRYLKAWSQ